MNKRFLWRHNSWRHLQITTLGPVSCELISGNPFNSFTTNKIYFLFFVINILLNQLFLYSYLFTLYFTLLNIWLLCFIKKSPCLTLLVFNDINTLTSTAHSNNNYQLRLTTLPPSERVASSRHSRPGILPHSASMEKIPGHSEFSSQGTTVSEMPQHICTILLLWTDAASRSSNMKF